MKNKLRNQGQVLLLTLILLPVLVICLGVVFRSGRILLAHNQIQNHCNRVVLDALAAQARGLHVLGQVNPWAKWIINIRRKVDTLLKYGGILIPVIDAELIEAREALQGAQEVIAGAQKAIILTHLMESREILMALPKENYGGEMQQTYKPTNLLLPHILPNSLRLHVEAKKGYESETGAPMQLDKDFSRRQIAKGSIKVQTETFLSAQKWPDFAALPPMFVQCKAHVEMEDLEGKWEVRLNPIEASPSWRQRLSFL